ncbi:hypothetical protein F1559_001879 [Cyanidiococcus yangmingshanensis]|uniref:Uncharacterized protein n=1 Tax=Cyanidiococcus yangmingshanensis TaxID=2690220 RepID=A0A7J7IKD1_9RHOD|nr:hypothetical protein F1559_001879 [Cyanidiococcus yangmingshanensis]
MRSVSSPRARVRLRLILWLYLAAACVCALWPAAWLLRLASRDDVVGELPERLPASRLFAVVVPISHAAELLTLRANFRYWRPGRETGGAAPCLFSAGQNSFTPSRMEHRPDLVVLSSRPLNASIRDRITEEYSRAPFCRNCFRSLRFLDCSLKPEHDMYTMSLAGTISSPYNGPLLTFLCMIGHPELWNSYHAAFLMELDAVPCKTTGLPRLSWRPAT